MSGENRLNEIFSLFDEVFDTKKIISNESKYFKKEELLKKLDIFFLNTDFCRAKKELKPVFKQYFLSWPFFAKNLFFKAKIFKMGAHYYKNYCFVKRTFKKINTFKDKRQRHAVFLGTPVHGNLGDQAIVLAEKQFLVDCGVKKSRIIELTTEEFYPYKKEIFERINLYSVVVIDGGGNLGSIWKKENDKILEIISNIKNAKIIVFPETIFYDCSSFERQFLSFDKSVYLAANNTIFFLRDRDSFLFFETNLKTTDHFLVPDIVFYLGSKKTFNKKTNKRKKHKSKAAIIIRSDKEKVLSDSELLKIKCFLKKNDIDFDELSTIYPNNISKRNRKRILCSFFNKIKKYDFIITDRLHGMIFSYINSVYAVALNNVNKKVQGSFEWINDTGCAVLIDGVGNLTQELIHPIPQRAASLQTDYLELKNIIESFFGLGDSCYERKS